MHRPQGTYLLTDFREKTGEHLSRLATEALTHCKFVVPQDP